MFCNNWIDLQRQWSSFNTSTKVAISTVRDLHTSLSVVGSLTSYFVKEFESQFSIANQLLLLTIQIMKIGLSNRIYTLGPHHVKLIVRCFNIIYQFHVCHWLKLYESKNSSDPQYINTVNSILESCMVALDTMVAPAPEEIQVASLQILRSLTESMQPSCLRSSPVMNLLFTSWDRVASPLQLTLQGSLFSSVCMTILIPAPPQMSAEFSNRITVFKSVIQPLVNMLSDISKATSENDVLAPSTLNRLERCITILSCLIFSIKQQPEIMRRVITEVLEGTAFSVTHQIFPFLLSACVTSSQTMNVLNTVLRLTNFHVVSFHVLRRQVSSRAS